MNHASYLHQVDGHGWTYNLLLAHYGVYPLTLEVQLLLACAVFVASGIVYALAGYKAKVYSFLSGDPDVKFDLKRISKKIGLGIFLGLMVFATEELINGDQIVDITNPGVFAKQVIFQMGAIYAFDTLMFKGKGGTKMSSGRVGATPPVYREWDDDDDDDISQVDQGMIVDDALDPPVVDSEPPEKE